MGLTINLVWMFTSLVILSLLNLWVGLVGGIVLGLVAIGALAYLFSKWAEAKCTSLSLWGGAIVYMLGIMVGLQLPSAINIWLKPHATGIAVAEVPQHADAGYFEFTDSVCRLDLLGSLSHVAWVSDGGTATKSRHAISYWVAPVVGKGWKKGDRVHVWVGAYSSTRSTTATTSELPNDVLKSWGGPGWTGRGVLASLHRDDYVRAIKHVAARYGLNAAADPIVLNLQGPTPQTLASHMWLLFLFISLGFFGWTVGYLKQYSTSGLQFVCGALGGLGVIGAVFWIAWPGLGEKTATASTDTVKSANHRVIKPDPERIAHHTLKDSWKTRRDSPDRLTETLVYAIKARAAQKIEALFPSQARLDAFLSCTDSAAKRRFTAGFRKGQDGVKRWIADSARASSDATLQTLKWVRFHVSKRMTVKKGRREGSCTFMMGSTLQVGELVLRLSKEGQMRTLRWPVMLTRFGDAGWFLANALQPIRWSDAKPTSGGK